MPPDRVILEGPGARIVIAPDAAGRYRAEAYLLDLARRRPEEFAKVQALLHRVAQVGPQGIRNTQRIRPLGDGLFEMKSGDTRLFWCYGTTPGTQRTVALLSGVTKKRRAHRPEHVNAARLIMSTYKASS